jgi:ABC-type bacteriocin/lantibiotic exporter with double-glycine peptidase domain
VIRVWALKRFAVGALVGVGCVLAARVSAEMLDRPSYLDASGIVRQRSTTDCGLAALATLASMIGAPLDYHELLVDAGIVTDGLTLGAIQRIASRNGISLEGVAAAAAESLPVPWLAHWRSGNGHYVVVERREGDGWIVADPGRGRIRYSGRAFRRRWSGYALVIGSSNADVRR